MFKRNASVVHALVALLLAIGLNGCASSTSGAMSIFNQLGGMDTVKSLAGNFLKSASGDSRTSSLFSGKDMSALTSKLSDQICSMTGGDCAAPLTKDQVKAGADKVTPSQSSALSDSFKKAVDELKGSPAVKEALNKAVGPSLGGIIGGLL
jgi:hypothetical protein